MLERRETRTPDDALQAALVRALEENALLRRALDERTLAPRARRWVGSIVAALIVVAALAAGALWLTQSAAGREFRREISGGYEEGRRDGRAARPSNP